MSKVKLSKEYREKYGWEMPTLKLARIMYKDNPLLFNSVDAARTSRVLDILKFRGNATHKATREFFIN